MGHNAPMFSPSPEQVRQFFCEAHRKHAAGEVLTPLETIAADWIDQHPEYHIDLADADAAARTSYTVEAGRTNPFLHLSMHLSIAEQVSIDQPRGIRAAVDRLAHRLGSLHEAHHQVMECLGDMLWTAQRSGRPPDGEAYVECVARRARG